MLKNERQDPAATNYPKAELVIIEKGLLGEHPTPVLAYRFDIYTLDPLGRSEYYVDTNCGEIVFTDPIMKHATAETRYSGFRTIETQLSGGSFRLVDATRGGGITTWNADNLSMSFNAAVHFTDNNDNWTAAEFGNANQDNAALDAHWGAEMTYDYFLQRHSRNSIDNAGSALNNYVHVIVANNGNNASWDGQRMIYGDGDGTTFSPLTSLDVVAHEIGHGFSDKTANLLYQKESGAIDESLSDIWGAIVEFFAAPEKQTYVMSEDISLSEDALRSMSNPKSFDQPDTYGGTNWFDVNGTNSDDDWGVHTNSGVMNHWFYLLAEGGSGTNDNGDTYNITGIGKLKAANIVYRAESNYFTSTTNYFQARAGA
ncbi:MAG: M4 family metallopeptidase [Sphingobacteriales bacterium]|nr:M4 family metallopeptidase [Sphingobacteriales bacterium]